MNILGISALYHDSAAALIRDGHIVAAAQEERFTRKKHDPAFPSRAIEACLRLGEIDVSQVNTAVFYEVPQLKADRLWKSFLATAPGSLPMFLKAMPAWQEERRGITDTIRKGLGPEFTGEVLAVEHHMSHAASAFYPSPFQEAAILTLDGVGEWATTTVGIGEGNNIRLLNEIRFPHSLGLLYSAFTTYCGFKINSGEYKLMGLAPYGEPKHVRAIYDNLIKVGDDGAFWLNQQYFAYCEGEGTTNERFEELFGGPGRQPESLVTQKEMDLAASIQVVTEEVVLRLAKYARQATGKNRICMAGGVALNCVANGRLLREGTFDEIWIQPAAGDAGGALGAALSVWHQTQGKSRTAAPRDSMRGAFLGPDYTDEQIEESVNRLGAVADRYDDDEMLDRVAALLADQKVVGWFRGRMEFGPRSLGARSILADPRSREMQTQMNLKIKFRESFRPFAPVVLREHSKDYFGLDCDSPYMLLVSNVAEKHRVPMPEGSEKLWGIEKLKVPRSDIPAATHVDYSARVQTIDSDRHGKFHGLLQSFYEKTGCPVLVNTSFNVRGEPIVCTPEDAYRCFMGTNIDVLVLGNHVLLKNRQPEGQAEEYYKQFALD